MGGSNGGPSLYPNIGLFNGQQGISQWQSSQAQALLQPSELANGSASQAAQAAQSQAVQAQMIGTQQTQSVPSPVEQAKVKLEIAQPSNGKRSFLSEDES